ncbi:TPA: hypothetical protein ACH3X3_001616 [Trebouxia sp. C0006]
MSLMALAGRGALRQLRSGAHCAAATSSARWFSAAPAETQGGAADEDDIVIQAFREQTKQYKQVYESAKNVAVPLNGDMDAIKKYAEEMQKIKKQAGALDPVEVADARMEYDLECSGYNVRQFLGTISGQGTLGEFGHSVMQDILALVTEVEQETDAVLDADNEEGWEMFQERVADISKKHGLEDFEKIKEEGIIEQYAKSLEDLRKSAEEDMEVAKRKDGLDWVNVDPAQLKPKMI